MSSAGIPGVGRLRTKLVDDISPFPDGDCKIERLSQLVSANRRRHEIPPSLKPILNRNPSLSCSFLTSQKFPLTFPIKYSP